MYVCSCRNLTEDEVRAIITECALGANDIDRFFEEFDCIARKQAQCHACDSHILELLEEHTKTARE